MKSSLATSPRNRLVAAFPSRCREHGLNLTPQRLAIYEALAASFAHPSAEELYGTLRPRHPSLSLATVYNTLETLHQVGLVSLVNVVHERARFDAETERHHHLICERCKAVKDVHDDALDRLLAPRAAGFRVRSHSVHFYGLCGRCVVASPVQSDHTKRKRPRR